MIDDLNLKDLGSLLQKARESKKDDKGRKISRESIGNAIGVSGQTVYEWEKGNQQPGFLNVIKYCKFLGISLEDMLGEKKTVFSTC